MKLLVDSDSIYFRPACSIGMKQANRLMTEKKKEMRMSIDRTMNAVETYYFSDDFKVAIKGRGNFRKDLYPEYKAQRKPMQDSVLELLDYGIEYFIEKYGAVPADGMEADDLVSIWANDAREAGDAHSVIGIDKDLLQIPGNHYNFVKNEHQFVDADSANLKLMLQCLTGDTSDNIKGLKGIGPKKADKIISWTKMDRRWGRVRAAWRSHGSGNPAPTWRLLKMIETWDEYEDIIAHVAAGTSPDYHLSVAYQAELDNNLF